MDEDKLQQKRRENEEQATASRARILGLPYLDTRSFENDIPLIKDMIPVEEMHKNFILPLQQGSGEEYYQYMVTSQTPRTLIESMRREFTETGERAEFFLISNSAYKVFMLRYDPPREAHYDDIKIADEGDSETIAFYRKNL